MPDHAAGGACRAVGNRGDKGNVDGLTAAQQMDLRAEGRVD
jgi:hypothetical protein